MPSIENESLAWSIYWSSDRLHSCIAAANGADQKVLEDIWAEFADELGETARLLDVATGNGAVPVALLRAKPTLKITGIDQAEIDPENYVSGRPELRNVSFLGSSDIKQLDFEQGTFDGITSQFGIEYAGLVEASSKAFTFLSDDGKFTFIIHHAGSELIKSSAMKKLEMSNLLADDGLLDVLHRVLRNEAQFSYLESLGQHYIDSTDLKTEAISGQVFSGIEEVAKLMASDLGQAKNLGATLKLRLQAEHDRLEQMLASAQSDQQIENYCTHFEQLGFTIAERKPIYIDQDQQCYLLAWLVKGQRSYK